MLTSYCLHIELNRDGINDMFDVLARNAVPFLVFSAGIGGEYRISLNSSLA